MLNKLIKDWSERYRARRKPDVVIGAHTNPPYMKRWWVIPRNKWFNIYLHEVGQDDDDRALHDHPWINMSYVVDGGYVEHTIENGGTHVRRPRNPGAIKVRLPSAAHRLELQGDKAVSLFITGPKMRKWGFHCPKRWVRWEEFVDNITMPDGTIVSNQGRGCGEFDDKEEKEPARKRVGGPKIRSSNRRRKAETQDRQAA